MRSVVFFPVLVSTIGVGLTFVVLMEPDDGLINEMLALVGIKGPKWLVNPNLALLSVALVDVWKGVGLATVIYIAGIVVDPERALRRRQGRRRLGVEQLPPRDPPAGAPGHDDCDHPSLIGGLRSFELIWAMTRGGPGFSSDVIASVIYKQYQAGFYGLSTAGNVVLFILVTAIILPLFTWLNRREVQL